MAEALRFSWDLEAIAFRFGWELEKGEVLHFSRISTDTRELPRDSRVREEGALLFLALTGARHDGHRFIPEAIARGARGVVVQKHWQGELPPGITVMRVEDTRRALGVLAHWKRRHYPGRVIAVTGSAGKTTTKILIQHLLGEGFAAPGNLNNDIGVPLSVFAAPLKEPFWIMELGMNARGEIAYLAGILEPQVAVLLPAGYAHIGFLGSREEILRAKAELLTISPPPELAILADPRYFPFLSPQTRAVFVHRNNKGVRNAPPPLRKPHYSLKEVHLQFPQGMRIAVSKGKETLEFFLNLIGVGFALPLALAAATSRELTGKVATQTLTLKEHEGRMKLHPFRDAWILDDSYNASPESYEALCATLAMIVKEKPLPLVMVLGEMKELGRFRTALHRRVARLIKPLEPSWIGVVGEELARALKREGVEYESFTEAKEAVRKGMALLPPSGILVLKGGHATGIFTSFQEVRKESLCSTP